MKQSLSTFCIFNIAFDLKGILTSEEPFNSPVLESDFFIELILSKIHPDSSVS